MLTINGDALMRAVSERAYNALPRTIVSVLGRTPPPDVVNAVMSPDGTAVVVTFNGDTSGTFPSSSGAVSCDRVFDNSNLGQGASCRWQSLSQLVRRVPVVPAA